MRTTLAALAAAIQNIGHTASTSGELSLPPTRTGWLEVDHALDGGLRRSVIHEWFDDADDRPSSGPPQSILIHLAEQVIRSAERGREGKRVLWIGRRYWPYPRTLIRDTDRTLLDSSVFVDPPNLATRVWAIDNALRSSAVAAVIADGHGIDMGQSRRLQLAAEAGQSLALFARPAADLPELSAAFTRWRAGPAVSPTNVMGIMTFNPRWTIELLRCNSKCPSGRSWRS